MSGCPVCDRKDQCSEVCGMSAEEVYSDLLDIKDENDSLKRQLEDARSFIGKLGEGAVLKLHDERILVRRENIVLRDLLSKAAPYVKLAISHNDVRKLFLHIQEMIEQPDLSSSCIQACDQNFLEMSKEHE